MPTCKQLYDPADSVGFSPNNNNNKRKEAL